MSARVLRIGTRRSRLARWQAEWVAERLRAARPGIEIEVVGIETLGDRDKSTALAGLGRAGVFTKEIEEALLDGRCDLAVHSFKDLATAMPAGLIVGAVPERADPRDALISRGGSPLRDLEPGALVGTSSLRRRALLLYRRPDLRVRDLRGNVPTRLRAVGIDIDEGRDPQGPPLDATVMAMAGLIRLGHRDHAGEVLDPGFFPPAPAQGALAVQIREDDRELAVLAGLIDHRLSRLAVTAERAFLETMEGGCRAPIGALAEVAGGEVRLAGMLLSSDGCRAVAGERSGIDPAPVGRELALELKAGGGEEILACLAAGEGKGGA